MSGNTFKKRRQVGIITGLVGILAVLAFLLFYYGQQHKIIIDNRAVETADGGNYRSLAGALVAVNHKTLKRDEITETAVPVARRPWISFKFWPSPDSSTAKAAELMPRERILVKVLGPRFNLKSEAFDRLGESLGVKEVDVYMGARRGGMIRLVKLHNDLPGYFEDFPNDASGRRAPDEEQPPAAADGEASPAAPPMGDI